MEPKLAFFFMLFGVIIALSHLDAGRLGRRLNRLSFGPWRKLSERLKA